MVKANNAEKYSRENLQKRASKVMSELDIRPFDLIGRGLGGVASLVSKYNPAQVDKFLRNYFGYSKGEETPYFPNGATVGNFLSSLQGFKWFQPRKQHTSDSLSMNLKRLSNLFEGKIISLNLQDDPKKAFNLTRKKGAKDIGFPNPSRWAGNAEKVFTNLETKLWNRSRELLSDEPEKDFTTSHLFNMGYMLAALSARKNAPSIASSMAGAFAGSQALAIMVGDKDVINPYTAIWNFYRKGLCPAGISEKNPSELVIWHPKFSLSPRE